MLFIGSDPFSAQSVCCDNTDQREITDVSLAQASVYQVLMTPPVKNVDIYVRLLALMMSDAKSINENNRLHSKTIVDKWATGYNVDIHNRIPILTSATASVNIYIHWLMPNIQLAIFEVVNYLPLY